VAQPYSTATVAVAAAFTATATPTTVNSAATTDTPPFTVAPAVTTTVLPPIIAATPAAAMGVDLCGMNRQISDGKPSTMAPSDSTLPTMAVAAPERPRTLSAMAHDEPRPGGPTMIDAMPPSPASIQSTPAPAQSAAGDFFAAPNLGMQAPSFGASHPAAPSSFDQGIDTDDQNEQLQRALLQSMQNNPPIAASASDTRTVTADGGVVKNAAVAASFQVLYLFYESIHRRHCSKVFDYNQRMIALKHANIHYCIFFYYRAVCSISNAGGEE
jgi:hypothetical protein